ncbi:MAG: hypothetical protein OES12_10040, partial [Anaerolineae bacterium]|nr:hypothetical protein [Anaerolineae bacterium]
AVGVILAFMRWPALGLIAVIGAIIIPFNGPSKSNATMALVGLLLGLWLTNMMIVRREIKLVPSRANLPLVIFVFIAGLAFGLGQLPWYTFAQPAPLGAQLGGLAIYVLSAGAFLLVAHQVRDIRWLQAMTWLFLALAALFIAGRIIPAVNVLTTRLFIYAATGSLFWVWLIALAFSQAVLNRKLHWGWRLMLGGLVVATFYVAYIKLQDWKSGWIPPLFTIVAILGFRFWKLGLVLLPFGITPASRLISFGIATDEYSYDSRLDAWTIILEMTKINPVLGLGPANYHWYTPLFPIRGWFVQFNSHSQYIDLIAQTGLLGLVCFLWFFGVVGWVGWQLRERVPPGFARAYVYGALGGLVGTLIAAALGDWVLPFFYNVTLGGFRASVLGWLFLGGLVALGQIYSGRGSMAPEE